MFRRRLHRLCRRGHRRPRGIPRAGAGGSGFDREVGRGKAGRPGRSLVIYTAAILFFLWHFGTSKIGGPSSLDPHGSLSPLPSFLSLPLPLPHVCPPPKGHGRLRAIPRRVERPLGLDQTLTRRHSELSASTPGDPLPRVSLPPALPSSLPSLFSRHSSFPPSY